MLVEDRMVDGGIRDGWSIGGSGGGSEVEVEVVIG